MTNVIPLYPRSAERNVRQGSLTQTLPVSPWLHPLTDRDCRALLMHERRVQWGRHYRCKHKNTCFFFLPVFTPSRSHTNKQRFIWVIWALLANFDRCRQMCKIKEVDSWVRGNTHTHILCISWNVECSSVVTLWCFVLFRIYGFGGSDPVQWPAAAAQGNFCDSVFCYLSSSLNTLQLSALSGNIQSHTGYF